MHQAIAYLPGDRHRALLTGQSLPARATGTVLFVDISGFTPLTETLARQFGRSRGAELLTRTLNEVYQALIDEVDQHGGSVIGFAGDAITCWFDAVDDSPGAAAQHAAASALAMQHAIERFARHTVAPGAIAELAIKIALASGPVRRLLVGDPAIQVIEVLAGAPLERMAAAEHVCERGELAADLETIHLLGELVTAGVWRRDENGAPVAVISRVNAAPRFLTIHNPQSTTHNSPRASLDNLMRPWLLPTVWATLQSDEEHYLAELRPATALFVRFTGLDFEDDEAAGDHLDAYIRWVQQVLARYAGTLIQLTTGDKGSYFYAAFGAPVAHDDDTIHAIAAALELRTSPSRFAFLTQVQLGIGAGMMRVGAYGSSTRRTYGVLGDATNLAARLMMDAEPGQILVSARVAELIQPRYRVEALGERQFKGKRQKQLVFAVIGQNSPTLIQLDALYRTPPLGRDAELAAITDAVNQAATGAGQLIRLEGEPGAGKSHLAAATARLAAAQGFSVLYGACQSAGQQSYAALRTPLAALLGLDERSAASLTARVTHLQATVAAIEPAWLVRLPLLGELLGLPIADNPTTATFDPRLRREALGSLVVSLFLHYARQRPLFLLLEDVHWLDEADQVIVLALCRALADWPLVICLLHHPMNPLDTPFVTALDTVQRQLHLHLGELTAQATAALVAQRLHGTVEPLVAALVFAQTQGNPFFAEELTDALRERGAILQDGEVWRAARSLLQTLHEANALERAGDSWHLRADAHLDAVTLGLPDTVHGLVLARLDLLPEETRLTVKVASVIGRVFETRVLAAAHPRAPGMTALQQQIAELEARDFARIEAPPPHPAYIFKHNITQEAIYHTLLESQRQELHLAVASVLERTAPAAVERLAHHYSQADITQAPTRARALFYLDAAAWRAKRSYANETALAYFERALALETRWEWLRSKCEVLHILGQRLQEEATLLVLEADPAADQTIVAELWAEFHEATSQFPAARADLQQALDAYAAQADQRNQARVLARLGEIVLREGDGDEAEQIYRQALSLLADARDEGSRPEIPLPHGRGSTGGVPRPSPLAPPTIRAQVLLGLGVVMRQRGEYDAAAAMLTEALNLYAAQENQPEVATALTRLGGVAFLRRDFGAARTAWQQALTIRRAIGDREGEGSSLLNIAQVYTSLGDYGAALPLLRQALDIQRAVGNRWWENAVWNALGIVALAVGDYAEARRCITQAEALCLAVGDEAGAAIMTFNLAQVDRACGDFAAALARLTRSRQWAQENDDPEFAAQCLTELALTAQAAGQLEIAEQHADAALHLYRTLEMYAAQSTDLATLALVQLARGARQQAHATAQQLLEIIDASAPHQIEYPQRDLYVAALAAAACGDTAGAAELLQRAYTLIQTHAADISDAALRQSFLENVAINRVVVAAMGSAPLRVG
jgi:predicted ATPase/class 3 adenylate cyclase